MLGTLKDMKLIPCQKRIVQYVLINVNKPYACIMYCAKSDQRQIHHHDIENNGFNIIVTFFGDTLSDMHFTDRC